MNRVHLVAAASCFLALGLAACDRSPEATSTTHTTSASPRADVGGGDVRDGGVQSQVGHSGHVAYDTASNDARDVSPFESREVAAAKDGGRAAQSSQQIPQAKPLP